MIEYLSKFEKSEGIYIKNNLTEKQAPTEKNNSDVGAIRAADDDPNVLNLVNTNKNNFRILGSETICIFK